MNKLKKILICVMCLPFFANAQSRHEWERTNPGGGGSFGVIAAGMDGTIYAGSDLSGVYYSRNGGQAWDVIGYAKGLTATHIAGIGFLRENNSQCAFFGTDRGLYRTENGVDNVSQVIYNGLVTDIQFGTNNTSIGYCTYHPGWNATNGQIYKTSNKGVNWAKINTSDLPVNIFILKIIVDPTDVNTLYILTGKGRFACGPANVYKSTNGGVNWSFISSSLGGSFSEVLDIALSPDNSQVLYLTTMNASCSNSWYSASSAGELYMSSNGGNTWRKMSNNTGVIFLKPQTNSQEITLMDPRYTASWEPKAGAWTSINGGVSFSKTGNSSTWDLFFNGNTQSAYQSSYNGIIKTIGTDLSNPSNYYWTNYQWVFKSSDYARNWTNIHTKEVSPGWWRSTGVDNVNMLDMDINKANPNIIYIGYFDIGIWRSLDAGNTWQPCTPNAYGWSNGIGGNTASIISDPVRSNVVWATSSANQKGQSPTYLLKNTFTGQRDKWQTSMTGLPNEQIMGLSLDVNSPEDSRTLYVTANQEVYKSDELDGEAWFKVLSGKKCRFTAVDYYNGSVVYAAGESGIYVSENAGATWKDITHSDMLGSTTSFWNGNYNGIFDIKTDPNHPNWIYVTVLGTSKGLYRSKNKGVTWEHILTDRYARKVAIHPRNPAILYVTCSSVFDAGGSASGSKGVMFSSDEGLTWSQVSEGMEWPFGMVVEVQDKDNPYVFVGSMGTGMQRSIVPTMSANNSKINLKKQVRFLPNPVYDILYLEGESSKGTVSLFDLSGTIIKSERSVNVPGSINLSLLESGTYLLKYETDITTEQQLIIKRNKK